MKNKTKKIAIIFILLSIGGALSTIIGYTNSIDMQGRWPLSVTIMMIAYLIYTAIYIWIDSLHARTMKFTIVYNFIVTTTLVINSWLYYNIVSINKAGVLDLSYAVDLFRINNSPFILLVISLLIFFIIQLIQKKEHVK